MTWSQPIGTYAHNDFVGDDNVSAMELEVGRWVELDGLHRDVGDGLLVLEAAARHTPSVQAASNRSLARTYMSKSSQLSML